MKGLRIKRNIGVFFLICGFILFLSGCKGSTELTNGAVESTAANQTYLSSTSIQNTENAVDGRTTSTPDDSPHETKPIKMREAGKNAYLTLPAFEKDFEDIIGLSTDEKWTYHPEEKYYSTDELLIEGTDCVFSMSCVTETGVYNWQYVMSIHYYDQAHSLVSSSNVFVFRDVNRAAEYFYSYKWWNPINNEEYKGTYYLLIGNIVIIHRPVQEADETEKVCKQTFEHLCSVFSIDAVSLDLKPIAPQAIKDYVSIEIPELQDSVRNLLGIGNNKDWQFASELDTYYLYFSPIRGTDCTFSVRYINDKNKYEFNSEPDVTVCYQDYNRNILATCYITIFDDGTKASQIDVHETPQKGEIVLFAGNVSIDFCSEMFDELYDAEMYYDSIRHMCSLLGIDYDALELFEFEAPETITYSQILCAFDAGLSAETIEKALEEIIPEGMQEADASELIKSDGMKSIRSWRDATQTCIFEEYEDVNMAKNSFNIFLGGASTVTSVVRIDSRVLIFAYTDGTVIKTLLNNLGLIEDIPDSYTIYTKTNN